MRLILILTALLAFQSAAASEFDETKALAEQGVAAAQFNLGIMYDTGLGVSENDAEAVKWFRTAADQGHAKPQMTPQQIADGQALASKCYESNYKDCDL